ncbi:MAG: DegQ family serine endoprotease [Gammaproteobacteria bacterium]|nr:DegQ family serine endoprotease [Gammaproteobacteria bacterium]
MTEGKLLKGPQRSKIKGMKTVAAAVALATSATLLTMQFSTPVLATAASATTEAEQISGQPSSFADLIEQVKPSVVNISVSGKTRTTAPSTMPDFQFPPDSQFEDFFRRFFDEHRDGAPTRKSQSLGSGFIIDPSGYVVTNHHVVRGADEVTVIMDDGTEYIAEIKGQDEKTDLALLKIETDNPLPYVEFADSEKARVGDWVIAIGNPFGLGGTATTGIISARGRDIQSGPFDDFIQVDAPINQGNSGGPLFDTQGRVIGVNTAIFSPNGGNVGIAFAIPATLATSVVDQLKANGKVVRGWLGVQIQTVTTEIAQSLDFEDASGALVSGVVEGSPAEQGGIKVGDVILQYGEHEVDDMKDLPRLVASTASNDTIEVVVWRDGTRRIVNVTVGKMSNDEKLASTDSNSSAGEADQLGLALAPLTPDNRQRFSVPEDAKGVLIVGVDRDSPAEEQGLRPGDVIKKIGNTDVAQPEEVALQLEDATTRNKHAVLLLVSRDGQDRFVAVKFA